MYWLKKKDCRKCRNRFRLRSAGSRAYTLPGLSSCACLFSPLHASFGSSMEKGGGHEQSQPYIHRAYNQRGSSSLFQVLTRQIPQENSDRLGLGHVSITNSYVWVINVCLVLHTLTVGQKCRVSRIADSCGWEWGTVSQKKKIAVMGRLFK